MVVQPPLSPPLIPESAAENGADPRVATPRQGIGDVLTIGFGTTVAMWAVGYVGHMPLTDLPAPVFVSLMLLCVIAGGFVAGRATRRGLMGGVWVGLVSACLNLLILGSLLEPGKSGEHRDLPPVWLWLPGTFVVSVLLALIGSAIGRRRKGSPAASEAGGGVNWVSAFAWVDCAAALLLIMAGGLVTGFRAGLAVPDWPNSWGYSMFTFPLTRMTGGAFYEHAHRLLGSLVGFTTLTLAIYLTLLHRRKWLMIAVWGAGVCVAAQAVLGGLRVTGKLTMSQWDVAGNSTLAVVHGFFAHVVFAVLVAVAVLTARRWTTVRRAPRPGASTDQTLTAVMVLLVVLQTLLGTILRQMNDGLLFHITVATFVAVTALAVGMRAWGLNTGEPLLRRSGAALLIIVAIQVMLGITAVAFRTPPVDDSPTAQKLLTAPLLEATQTTPLQALITTLHQTNAALLLGVSVIAALWTWRLLVETGKHETPPEANPVVAASA